MTTMITITDTGKRSTASGSAEETDMANSGSAITLYGVEVTLEENALLNTNASVSKMASAVSKFSFGEVDHIGIAKPKWTIQGVFNDDNASATHLGMIKILRDLNRTKGYKTLLCDLGDWSDGSANSSVVNVCIAGVTMHHRANSNIIDYQISAYETE